MKIFSFTCIMINLIVALDCDSSFDHPNSMQNNVSDGFIYGDYSIGALFPIRERIGNHKSSYECGNISEYGIQVVEAAFFAIELINRNENILPNVTLGIEIKDYCRKIEIAQLRSKEFIDASFHRCKEDVFSYTQFDETPLIGIIGPENHMFSKEVGNVLNFFNIVQITYSELSPRFANYEIGHPYFFSVIPEKHYMIDAIFELLIANDWTYISIVYSEDLLGYADLVQFRKTADQKSICIGDEIQDVFIFFWVLFYQRYKNSKRLRHVLANAKIRTPSFEKVNVIVCFCSSKSTNELFFFLENVYPTKRFIVISGNGWPLRRPHERKHEDVAVGEIVVSMEENYVEEFDDYFLNLDLNMNKRNPWSAEFWQQHFKNTNKTLADGYKQNPKIPHVIKSVFVLAHALHNMKEYGCGVGHNGVKFNQSCFKDHLQNVTFDFFGKSFKFEALGQTPEVKKYNFYNFQRFQNGSYDYVQVGEYDGRMKDSHRVKLNQKLVYPGNETSFNSTCKAPCLENQTKAFYGDKCCWQCMHCGSLQKVIVEPAGCEDCEPNFEPSQNKTSCIAMPTKYIKWHEAQTLVSILFSSLNIFLALFTFYVFFKYKNTPVVKSSTTELCYMMLFGMIFANLTPFTILRIPNAIDCVIIRILPPISFTFIYAALLVKTNRVARILAISEKKFPNLNPKFLSLKAQVMFTVLLIIVEILVCSYSLWKNPIEIKDHIFKNKDSSHYVMKICLFTENTSIMLETFAFISVLILICTYYAVKTRNLPENFNEAKYIGFAMYATILTDVAFGLIYSESTVKILALNLYISVNTFIVLVFLFTPKLYVILRMPEKNTRANFVTTTSIRCFIANRPESSEQTRSSSINKPYREKFEKNCESCMRRSLQKRKNSSVSTIY